MDINQRIAQIEEEIRKTPHHKGTERHIGKLRARLAKLRDELFQGGREKGGGRGFAIKKAGDATVVLVGFPSVGKSTLLNRLTNAKSPVAPYEFTTVSVIPGMMRYKGAYIQILDVPGLVEGAAMGRGRGREVLSVVRGADLLLLITEVGKKGEIEKIKKELSQAGVRINQKPPKVKVKKTQKGGLSLRKSNRQALSDQTIKEILGQFGLVNAEVSIGEKLTIKRLIDGLAKSRVWVPALYLLNKIDLVSKTPDTSPLILISAEKGVGIKKLKEKIWQELDLVRVYLAKPGEKPDYNSPILVRRGSSLWDVAKKIGQEFVQEITAAKISGPGADHRGQKVSLSHQAEDGMEVVFLS